MVTAEDFEVFSAELYVYDVEQRGWEHEHKGMTFNVAHIAKELGRSIIRKSFVNPDTVEQEIAPDMLQYAVRLARHTQQGAELILPPDGVVPSESTAAQYGMLPAHHQLYLEALATLQQVSHDYDHAKERDKARAGTKAVARTCAGLLIRTAELQAEEYDFDLANAFTLRLAGLRRRFNIAQPS